MTFGDRFYSVAELADVHRLSPGLDISRSRKRRAGSGEAAGEVAHSRRRDQRVARNGQDGDDRVRATGRLIACSNDQRDSASTERLRAATIVPRSRTTTEGGVSVERTGSRKGLPYKVRWVHAGVHHARRFATASAAEKFDRKVKDLKAPASCISSTRSHAGRSPFATTSTRSGGPTTPR
jgi:hypothetical protein